jgi:hypothetical protein
MVRLRVLITDRLRDHLLVRIRDRLRDRLLVRIRDRLLLTHIMVRLPAHITDRLLHPLPARIRDRLRAPIRDIREHLLVLITERLLARRLLVPITDRLPTNTTVRRQVAGSFLFRQRRCAQADQSAGAPTSMTW